MDDARFDALSRLLAPRRSRRAVVALVAAFGVGGGAIDDAAARPRKKCKRPRRRCGNRCVAVLSDPRNCGRCGIVCPTGECRQGTCRCQTDGQCPAGCRCYADAAAGGSCGGSTSGDPVPCTPFPEFKCSPGAACLAQFQVCTTSCLP